MAQQTWRKCPKMTHEEWLEWRRNGIGGSDAPVIMQDSPWTTPFQKWEEKIMTKSEGSNAAMKRGNELEEPARIEFERLMNVSVFPVNIEHLQNTWLRASLDGLDLEGKVMVEIKCPNKIDHSSAINKKVPDKYFAQCQHQLAVTGLPGMYYFSFDGSKGVIVEVARDEKYIKERLFPKEEDFWDLVLKKIPPPLTEKDYADMEKNAEWLTLTEKWKELNQTIKAAEANERQLRDHLIALSNDRSARGNQLSLTKSICPGAINYQDAIQEYLDNMRSHYPHIAFPAIAFESYRKPSFVKWTIRGM